MKLVLTKNVKQPLAYYNIEVYVFLFLKTYSTWIHDTDLKITTIADDVCSVSVSFVGYVSFHAPWCNKWNQDVQQSYYGL